MEVGSPALAGAERELVDDGPGDELVLGLLEHRADPAGQRGRAPPVRGRVGVRTGERFRGGQARPVVGASRPPSSRARVDLPDPLGPSTASASPARIVRSTPASAARAAPG